MPALAEKFHGPLSVDLGNDNLPDPGGFGALDNHQVARQDAGVHHRVAFDLEEIGSFLISADTQARDTAKIKAENLLEEGRLYA